MAWQSIMVGALVIGDCSPSSSQETKSWKEWAPDNPLQALVPVDVTSPDQVSSISQQVLRGGSED